MIVVDASAVVEVLLLGPAAAAIEARWRESGSLHSSQLVDLEVLQVLRRLLWDEAIDDARAELAVSTFEKLRVRRWSHGPLRRRIWELRHNVSAYDASYVALAERFACPLVTHDGRLARASGHRASVELF